MRWNTSSIWSNVRESLSLLRAHSTPFVRRRVLVVLALVIAAAVFAPLGSLALKLIVDAFTVSGPIHGLGLGISIALYVFTQWLAPSMHQVQGLAYVRAERRLLTNLGDRFFGHVMRLPHRFHLRNATGATRQALENGLQGLQILAYQLVFTVLPILAQVLVTAWILFQIHQPLFLALFCAAVICYALAFTAFVIRMTKAAEQASASNIEASAVVTDSMVACSLVKYFTAETLVQNRVHEAFAVTEQHWVRFFRGYAVNGLVVATIFAAFLGTAIVMTAREVSAGRMTVGELVLINTYMLQLTQPVEMLGFAVRGISQGAAMMAGMLSLLRENTEHVGDVASQWGPPRRVLAHIVVPASLEFRDAGFSYAVDRPAVRHLNFVLPAGKTFALVGTSGVGKSTIGNMVARLIEADTGEILLDGIPAAHYPLLEWRQAIGVVPQDSLLFNESIGYNIAFGRHSCTQADVERAAKLAHLHQFIMSLPEKYDTRVGERGMQLSGGQRQRVSIARAAIKEPRLYMFDEGTSSLDSRTEADIMRNLRELARTTTTLIIAHRLSTIVHADQILMLGMVRDAGEILERGTHAELLARDSRYAALWSAQHGSANRALNAC